MSKIQTKLVFWHLKNKRDLPWRNSKSAYKIWLSEIIMQQTQILQGTPYYLKFVLEFPTIKDLADASEEKVMSLWQGLGYYSRARNLHKTAKWIVEEYNGIFPSDQNQIIKLPGIGEYTCAAISTFAFNNPLPLIDGNVYRLYSRLFDIPTEINTTNGKKEFSKLAQKLLAELPLKEAVIYNEAIMEYGALVCKPKNPDCENCKLIEFCLSKAKNTHLHRPQKKPSKKKTQRSIEYLFIRNTNGFWLRKRTEKDIWQGLNELFLLKDSANNFELPATLVDFQNKLKAAPVKTKHILSHQILDITFHTLEIPQIEIEGYKYVEFHEISQFGFPKPIIEFLNTLKID